MERLQLQFEGGCFGGHINIILVVLYTHFDFRMGEKRVSIKKFVRLNSFYLNKKIQTNKFFNSTRIMLIWTQKQPPTMGRCNFTILAPGPTITLTGGLQWPINGGCF